MPEIESARDLRALQKLPFCYVCGRALLGRTESTRDHVPAKSCISHHDRAVHPLILPSHKTCNEIFKVEDERVGQYLSILHGRLAKPEDRRLKYEEFANQEMLAEERGVQTVCNVDLYGAVFRWLRAFHAALYHQPMPQNAKPAIELPVEVVSPRDDGSYDLDAGRDRQRQLCERVLRDNRLTKTFDKLTACNENVIYEYVWALTRLHAYCVFWIDFYGWRRLARLNGRSPRECVGFYCLSLRDLPAQATRQTELIIDPNDQSRFGP